MRILSILNKKGGVGKTTISTNLAQGLAILGKKVLVIDNDEQHNLTASVGLSLRDCPVGLADIYSATSKNVNKVVSESIYESFLDGLHCIPGSKALEATTPRRTALKEALSCEAIKKMNYDCVIIDNPPAMGENTRCAIACTDFFILPVQLKQFAINGLLELMQALTVEYRIERSRILIIRNMFKSTVKSRVQASESLATCYPENVLEAVIPEDEVFEKMVCENKSMFFSKSTARAALPFQELICEIFGLKKEKVFATFEKKLREYRSSVAVENLQKARIINLSVKEGGGDDE